MCARVGKRAVFTDLLSQGMSTDVVVDISGQLSVDIYRPGSSQVSVEY